MSFASHILNELKVSTDIESSIKSFFLSEKPGIVYGAGLQARIVLDFSNFFKKNVICMLASENGYRRMEAFYDHIPLYRIGALPASVDKDHDVIIAVNEKFNAEILATLGNNGFSSLHYSHDWKATTLKLRDFWLHAYLKFHGFVRRRDVDGTESYLRHNGAGRMCEIHFPENDSVFTNNISPMLTDILSPSILDDFDYLIEGPYEHGNVMLREGDVVFDLGANLGLFTSVAATKGCFVHAFEPVPATLKYLEKNAAFYPNVVIHRVAVMDKSGEGGIINIDLSDEKNLGNSSILLRDGFSALKVNVVSLDEFVEERELSRVDFIKADLEGAERHMLRGAKHTLGRFAPKLALCTYHLPDDPEVMERLILEANPSYRIEHKWSKLYAYVPNSDRT